MPLLALSALAAVLAVALVGLVGRLRRTTAGAAEVDGRLEAIRAALDTAAAARASAAALPLVDPPMLDAVPSDLAEAPEAPAADRRPDGRRRTRSPRPLHAVPPLRRDP